MSTRSESSIALRLAELVRDVGKNSGVSVLNELTATASALLPGAQYCGITTASRDGAVETVGATHSFAVVIDQIQRRRREGPCLSAAWEHPTVTVDDLRRDQRWPRFRRDALAETPVRSMLSYQLFAGRKQGGAINFYAERPNAFGAEAREEGVVLAAHTAVAWRIILRDNQFRDALASRDIIGQAKGIIMERFDVDAVQAFELLKRLSQDTNTPLAKVAENLISVDHPRR